MDDFDEDDGGQSLGSAAHVDRGKFSTSRASVQSQHSVGTQVRTMLTENVIFTAFPLPVPARRPRVLDSVWMGL